MSIKMNKTFCSLLFQARENIPFIPSAWSVSSCRGAKSYNEIPRAPEIPIFGSKPYIIQAGGHKYMHKYVDKLHKELGPIFVARMGKQEFVYIADADANHFMYSAEGQYPKRLVLESWRTFVEENNRKRGLFFMNDEDWFKTRTIFTKMMLKQNSMEKHVQRVDEVCKELMEIWKLNPSINLKNNLYRWNVECTGEIVFGKRLGFIENLKDNASNSQYSKEEEFIQATTEVFAQSAKLYFMSIKYAKLLKRESLRKLFAALTTVLDYGELYVKQAIEDCKAETPSENIRESVVYKALIEHGLDEEIIAAVVIDLFLASPDTITHAASWALYLLGRNPDVANKARKEIFSNLQNSPLTLDTILNMKYVSGIVKETLRLYSIAAFVTRTIASNVEFCGYFVPAGTHVMSSMLTMGKDPNAFPDPESFRPERWWTYRSGELESMKLKRAHTPFASGGRSCVGRRVAELNLYLLIIETLRNFECTVDEEIEPIMQLITVPSKPIKLNLKPLSMQT